MRPVLIALLLMTIIAPQVHAVGIATMQDLSNFELDEGDQVDIDFSLRGDDTENTVTFYLYSSGDGNGLSFNNKQIYEEEFRLNIYENEEINIEMEALRPGIHTVTWGYRQGGDDGGFDIESYVEDTFVVEVKDIEDYDYDDFDIIVDATEEESSSSSGGGGGGGGLVTTNSEFEEERVYDEWGIWYDEEGNAFDENGIQLGPQQIEFLKKPAEEQEVILQDASTQGSALNELVVDDAGNDLSEAFNSPPTSSVGSDDGKNVLAGVMVLGVLAILFVFGAIKYVGKDE